MHDDDMGNNELDYEMGGVIYTIQIYKCSNRMLSYTFSTSVLFSQSLYIKI